MKKLRNKVMDSEVYALRRRVMALIYEIKEMVDIPRVEVRITDDHDSVLGMGSMGPSRGGRSWIWITERAITASEFDLRSIVYHEVLHAVYGVGHNDSCPLMKPTHTPLSKAQAQKHFMKYAKKVKPVVECRV